MPDRPFEVIESSCVAKTSADTTQPGDDLFVVTPAFAAVIDGAGSWSGRLSGLTPGRFAAEAVARGIGSLPADASIEKASEALSETLHLALAEAVLQGVLLRPPTCVAAMYSAARSEVWLIGDCQARVDGVVHPHPLPTDERAVAFRQALLQAKILTGESVAALQASDPSWPLMKPLFEAAPAYQNHPTHPLGYGAFDGQNIPRQHQHVIPVPAHVQEVVLASDGYPLLLGTLRESEDALWALRERDPLMIGEYPGTRPFPVSGGSFDDRTYLRLRLI